jgi:hypothetical protein
LSRDSSSRRFSFQRKPPVFLGRSRSPVSRRRGDRLRSRSPISGEVERGEREGVGARFTSPDVNGGLLLVTRDWGAADAKSLNAD